MSRTIYFVAGEASGDNHGAALMKSLRKKNAAIAFSGRGGPQMESIAGGNFRNWIAEAAVVGLWEVVKNYGYFRQQFDETIREITEQKPDAVVLIDYPGFNLRLARTIKRLRLTNKIICYISPQVWAWNRGRIKHMAKYLDLMLCIFPFEADLYNKSGLRTKFVGHPMIDRLRPLKIEAGRDPNLIGFFPGSRHREISKHLPILLETARELFRAKQTLRFEIAAASKELADEIEEAINDARMREGLFSMVTGQTASTMQRATVGIVASGSATLEAAFFRLPFVLIYKVSWPTYLVGRTLVRVNHLGMPNVLANSEVAPEFIQHAAKPKAIAQAVLHLLANAEARTQMTAEFDKIIASLGEGGAGAQAAHEILQEIA